MIVFDVDGQHSIDHSSLQPNTLLWETVSWGCEFGLSQHCSPLLSVNERRSEKNVFKGNQVSEQVCFKKKKKRHLRLFSFHFKRGIH